MLFFGLLASVWECPAREDVAIVWKLVARHQPAEAAARLSTIPDPRNREDAFARAVILMDSQPMTEVHLAQAAAQLEDLARGDDEIAQAAGYLAGRLYQLHLLHPDYERAARAFQKLAARFPDGYWAQLGLVKLALLELYVLPEPAVPAKRIEVAEALLARVRVPELRRDLHMVIGRARLFHGQPLAGVLMHLEEADRVGGLANLEQAKLKLQIAELSRRQGDTSRARLYFESFIRENEADARVYTAKAKLAEILEGKEQQGARP